MDNTKRKKDNTSSVAKLQMQFTLLRTIMAVAIALIIVLIIVFFVSEERVDAIYSLLVGPFTSFKRFANIIETMIPLTFTGLGLTIVFKTKRFNLASDSALYMGGMAAMLVALYSPLPGLLTIVVALLAGFLVGGIIGYIPAKLESLFKANELVTSLMLNYIVGFFVNYILNYWIRDPMKSTTQSQPIPESAKLFRFIDGTRIHSGFIIMLVLVFVTWFVMYKTKWGYALRATGENEKFAKYNGIKVAKIIILAQVIGTAIAGLGGAIEILGMESSFKWTASPGYGFDGVIITTLAGGNPILVPIASFFLAYIRVGADILNRTTNIPTEIISIVQATIIILIAGQAFLAKAKHRILVKQSLKLDEENQLEVLEEIKESKEEIIKEKIEEYDELLEEYKEEHPDIVDENKEDV